MARLLWPVRSMATRSGTLARIRLRAAVRRQSWRKRVGTPAAWQAVRHAVRQRRIVIPSRWKTSGLSSPESYRTWDAGRRATPLKILARAKALATHRDDHALLPLPVLALLIGVHVKTLRSAARDGRLPVTYDTRTTFRRLRARATPAAATQFRRSYYGRPVKPVDRRTPLTWASVPSDYDAQIRALRRARGLSQGQLATLVGAARKAVVYQWEARKRTPSPVFWQRITALHR